MGFLEDLQKIKPSIYSDNKPYSVTYQLPSGEWHVHAECCLYVTWCLCRYCAELGRPVKVKDNGTSEVFGTEVAILNLFYNRINDRNALRHEPSSEIE